MDAKSRTYKMKAQPSWPDREPDKITDIVGGGFVDGDGARHYAPVSLAGLRVSLHKDADGVWCWHGEAN
jgi:hypothetical protein